MDYNVTHVWDMCAGSAAAAMAAGICGIGYEGLAISGDHANWLNRIIDKAMFGIIADRADEESKILRADLAAYFSTSIEEARLLLTRDADDYDDGEDDDDDDDA